MDWNLFIIPLTIITVELIKKAELDSRWLPFIAVAVGGVLGVIYAAVYPAVTSMDWLNYIVSGVVYGAAASGVCDAGASALKK